MIRFKCPACQKTLKILEEGAGRKINCPKCGQRMLVPTPVQPAIGNNTARGSQLPESSSPSPTISPPTVPPVLPVDAKEQSVQSTEEPGRSRQTRGRMFLWTVAIVGGSVLLLVFIAVLASLDSKTLAEIVSGIFLLLAFVTVVGGIIGLIFVITGSTSSCPKCSKWWAKVFIEKRIIEKKKCYGLVTRRAYSSSSGSISGASRYWGQAGFPTSSGSISGSTHSSGTTSWKERVPVIRTTYLLTYECKFCHARWTKEKVEQVEDFDIER